MGWLERVYRQQAKSSGKKITISKYSSMNYLLYYEKYNPENVKVGNN